MKRSRSICELHYSRLLSVPLLRDILYATQLWMVCNTDIHHVYISAKNHKNTHSLFRELNRKYLTIVCTSYKFSRVLANVSVPCVLRLNPIDPKSLSMPELYKLLWTLVHVSYVTPKTKDYLSFFIPEDFPVIED